MLQKLIIRLLSRKLYPDNGMGRMPKSVWKMEKHVKAPAGIIPMEAEASFVTEK